MIWYCSSNTRHYWMSLHRLHYLSEKNENRKNALKRKTDKNRMGKKSLREIQKKKSDIKTAYD